MDRDIIIEKLRATFASADEPSVVCAYLFGSVARGEQGRASDVDVAVLFEPPPPPSLLGPASRLQGDLEEALSKEADLMVLNQAAPDLVHRVLRDGILVFERDASRRVQFELKARNAYFDVKPHLDQYRKGGQAVIAAALVEKRRAFIETCVRELRKLSRIDALQSDVREQRFVQHTPQMALQAALDASSHIVSARRLGEPETNRELFALLVRDGWVSQDRLPLLQAMAGLRNVLVHGYQQADNEIVRDVVENRLQDRSASLPRCARGSAPPSL